MTWNLEGKTAVVTGGGRGIGRAVAQAMRAAGAQVAVLDIDLEAAKETCEPQAGVRNPARAFRCDVSSEAEIEDAIERVVEDFAAIDILFNNAGINRRIRLDEWTAADWNALIQVNFVGAFCVARAVGRHMLERRKGSIVNMAALGGAVVGLGRGTEIYTGTKGAVAAMSRDLAAEWAPYGVRVNCVAPGWIRTAMNSPLLNDEIARNQVVERVPMGRWGDPADIVGPVLFLASDHSAYITGHMLPIDGGASSIIKLVTAEAMR